MSFSLTQLINKTLQKAALLSHPVGSVYIAVDDVDPSTLFGGTWERLSSGLCLWTSDGTNTNTTISAGLPNITGGISGTHVRNNVGTAGCGSGAVVVGANRSAYTGSYNESTGSGSWDFDASRCSSIYGNSTTVQPPALVVSMWKRIS